MHNHHLVIKPTQKNIFFYMVLMQTTYHLSISLSQMPPNQSLVGMLLLDHDINFFLGGGGVFKLGFWSGRAVANHACRGLHNTRE